MVPPRSDRVSRAPPYSRTSRDLRLRGCHPLRPTIPGRSASSHEATGLFRFRSPLLAESRLMSVPPGTEMFQFPGFASTGYGFTGRYPIRGGLPHSDIHGSTPARGSPWLLAACHVLHRLLVPRHPPNALLILDTTPCTGTIHAGNTGHGRARPTKDRRFAHTLTLVQTPLNTPVARGGATARTPKGHGRTTRSDERRDRRRTHPGPHPHPPERTSRTRGRDTPRCPARPGTHQNPIHLSKEPAPHTGCHTGRGRRPTPWGRSHRTRTSTPPHSRGGAPIRHTRARVRGADTSRDDAAPTHPRTRVETAGFEPATPCLQSRCSPG